MSTTYDVVIVGGGPSGLMAARAAGEEGLRTALLERKHDIPKIHRSCGGVMNVNEPTFGEVLRFDEDRGIMDFTTLGFTIAYDGPFQSVYGFHLYAPGGRRLEFGDFARLRAAPRDNRLGLSISKERLLRTLLEEAAANGVEVFADTNVCCVRNLDGGAVAQCDDGREFQGTFVLAADGINSRIARVLGLNKKREFYGTSRNVSLAIQGTACPDPEGFLFMITGRGIFSMIPIAEKDCYHLYYSTYRRKDKPLDDLYYFFREAPTFSDWYTDSEILEEKTSCVVNLMNPIEVPVQGNIVFIGDACWRREMSNVGAICTGWKAAKTVAAALRDNRPDAQGLQPYCDWYRQNFFEPAGRLKQGGRDFTEYLSPEDIDYLAGLPEETFPQTMDIFKVVKCIGKTYSDLLSRVYDEHPDIMEKLVAVRENMDDDMKQRIAWGFRNA